MRRHRTEFQTRVRDEAWTSERPGRAHLAAGQREPGGPRAGGGPRQAHAATPTSYDSGPVTVAAWAWVLMILVFAAAPQCGDVGDPTGPPDGMPAGVRDAP